ncbi:MarR family winged helix-turn-helix transcriptional regulator [Actinacidiphila sp. ITFR-21]|uniref:MarR family winged helix-turn-helix transcriptional regulator n=1 Tax=Actinacidiphila sp. ITFR-21 TaxID=3075199 RepID=UPI002889A45C|nr:MarR family transcriptional regulator [Streptomyces sp. ITFR-21]WNI15071.1 MarR family transcriptional regulator [Streptomyces sp. ITFR-21]
MDGSAARGGGTTGAGADTGRHLAERTAFQVYRLGELVFRAAETGLAALALNGRTYFVLAGIEQGGPVSQQDLSRMFGIDPTTIVAIVDELERAGSVRRERSTVDRRRYELHLTREGARTLRAAHRVMDEVEAEFLRPLAPADVPHYRALTQQVLDRHRPVGRR